MQDPKYAGKYGVEQQLKLLSKWLAETGFGEASVLVSAAAISVYEATHKKPAPRLRHRTEPPAAEPMQESATALDLPILEPKRRAHGT
jgi:hypothetical protein